MLVWALLVLALALCAALYYATLNQNYWRSRGVPAPRPSWLFGNYKEAMCGTRHLGLVFQDMYNAFPEAEFVGYLKMRQPCVLLRAPALVRDALVSHFSSFAENDVHVDKTVDPLLGNNPFVLNGEEWKRARAVLTTAVTAARLKTYLPAVLRVCDALVEHVRARAGPAGSAELETKELGNTYTTDVIANAVLGLVTDSFRQPDHVLLRITATLFKSTFLDNLKVLLVFLFPQLSAFLRLRMVSRECEAAMLGLTRRVLSERLHSGETRSDFFQHLINYKLKDTKNEFTDEYIAAQIFEFVADGTETSSNTLCFTLLELAWHEEVQERVRQEAAAATRAAGGQLTFEALAQMKYLDMVLAESLRLHPPAMHLTRTCTRAHALSGVALRPGTPVTVPVYALHTDPRHFPQPHRFLPERFAPEAVAAREPCTYLPFGEGPRICPGMKFAQLQVKAALARLVTSFRLRPSGRTAYPPALDPHVFLKRPLGGAWVHFRPTEA